MKGTFEWMKHSSLHMCIIIIIIIYSLLQKKTKYSFLQMLQDLHFDANVQNNIFMKASNIAIRCPYYIYCRRNKQWTCPNLLNF